MYFPAGNEPDARSWQELIGPMIPTTYRGNRVAKAIDDCGMVPLHDSKATYIFSMDRRRSNLDLVFATVDLIPLCDTIIAEDSFSSDHLPVIVDINISSTLAQTLDHRINTRKVNWSTFRDKIYILLTEELNMYDGLAPRLTYQKLLDKVIEALQDSGARLPGNRKGKRKSQPLWWNDDCEEIISKRSEELKKYLACQTRENLIKYKRMSL